MMTADEGVPRFWASATANLPSSAYVEFVQQPGRYPASLGLGLILRPELALARAQPWETNSTKPMLYQKVRGPSRLTPMHVHPLPCACIHSCTGRHMCILSHVHASNAPAEGCTS